MIYEVLVTSVLATFALFVIIDLTSHLIHEYQREKRRLKFNTWLDKRLAGSWWEQENGRRWGKHVLAELHKDEYFDYRGPWENE